MNQKEESIYDKKDAVETDVQEVVAEADAYYIDPVIQKRVRPSHRFLSRESQKACSLILRACSGQSWEFSRAGFI
jgi:hypothetical protein